MRCQVHLFNYSIRNASQDAVDIFIDGDIVDASTQKIYEEWFGDDTTTSYKSFRKQLEAVEASTYNVYINSGGGLVTDAMAIHDLLQEMQAKGKTVNTIGRGIIASAATYILMASKTPRMSKNSWFMIHNVSGFAWGDVDQVEKYYNTLRKFNNRSRDFYAEATGISKDDIEKMMKEETWMTADEAKENGFIAAVEGEVEFTNRIPKEKWSFSNQAVLNSYNSSVREKPADTHPNIHQKFDDMKKFFQQLGQEILNAIKGVKQPENGNHEQLMESIGTAVQNAMEQASEKFESELNTATAEAVKNLIDPAKNEAFKQTLMDFISNQYKELAKPENQTELMNSLQTAVDKKLENLATKEDITQLEQDITEIKGQKSAAKDDKTNSIQPIGEWSE